MHFPMLSGREVRAEHSERSMTLNFEHDLNYGSCFSFLHPKNEACLRLWLAPKLSGRLYISSYLAKVRVYKFLKAEML